MFIGFIYLNLLLMCLVFSICIITPGKYCTIKAGAIPKLLAMLENDSSELVVNALKV